MFLNIKSATLLPHQKGYGHMTPRIPERKEAWKGWIPVEYNKNRLDGEIQWQIKFLK